MKTIVFNIPKSTIKQLIYHDTVLYVTYGSDVSVYFRIEPYQLYKILKKSNFIFNFAEISLKNNAVLGKFPLPIIDEWLITINERKDFTENDIQWFTDYDSPSLTVLDYFVKDNRLNILSF